ncbi:hypothetical protein W04_0181 [Pseudoalteromonas sp. SW0106-04]|nr:hypothetical protein W04_0181 [Pseudoalteromonas sp. SW0106-04]
MKAQANMKVVISVTRIVKRFFLLLTSMPAYIFLKRKLKV